jgi:hypothetical protein
VKHRIPEGRLPALALVAAVLLGGLRDSAAEPPLQAGSPWAEIRVIDPATGRGVPLVDLETVNKLHFVTDDLGRVAFQEPGLMGREIFFHIRSHGHEFPADGFGFRGLRIVPRAGETVTIELPRTTLAERVCRLTGEGKLRDSILLGRLPLPVAPLPGGVAGQDSVQAVPYGGEIHWFWGDTHRMSYPLGLFRTAGATTPRPDSSAPPIDPIVGMGYRVFTAPATEAEPAGFARAMMPLPERPEGVIWIDGVCVVPDDSGRERMLAHYSRRKGLEEELEQGIAIWDEASATFVVARQLPLDETWRRPSTHALVFDEAGRSWLLFGAPTPNVRVPATLRAVLDPEAYEAFSCASDDGQPRLGPDGAPQWRWQQAFPPTSAADERRWVDTGKLRADQARFLPADAGNEGHHVRLHSGTVAWNRFVQRWILVAGEIGGTTSHLGEVWYAEAEEPTGPFTHAVKILTHDRQSFYNVCHHEFLDRDGGRTIHFEGTYTHDFSGNPLATPRADYNQILYRLDLARAHEALEHATHAPARGAAASPGID